MEIASFIAVITMASASVVLVSYLQYQRKKMAWK